MLAHIDKTAKCSECGTTIHLLVQGGRSEWHHPGFVPGDMHDATPDRNTIRETGQ